MIEQKYGNVVTLENPRIIPKLSSRQIRLGLLSVGITQEQVLQAIETISDQNAKRVAKIEWEYAIEYERNHPMISSVGALLGFTEEQIDQLFITAANL